MMKMMYTVWMYARRTVTLLLWWWLLLSTVAAGAGTAGQDNGGHQPQNVHLSWGDTPNQVVVLWATSSPCSPELTYGTTPWRLDLSVTGRSVTYNEHNLHGLHVLHRAVMKGLKGATTYFYRPSCNRMSRGPFYFQSPPDGSGWSPNLLVVGDLGSHKELLPVLSQEALTGQYTGALQLTSLSSYFADGNGTTGDDFMKGIEHLAAFMPFLATPGSNETADGQYPGYRNRFSVPGSAWPIPANKLWYSFNLGPVHFVSYCTDIYIRGDKALQSLQDQWLARDLSAANAARDKRPWIVAFGYHPLYCSHDDSVDMDCAKNASLVRAGLEETLFYYGVDLILQGQAHTYQRFFPLFKGVVLANNYTNPQAPVQIVTGAASSAPVSAVRRSDVIASNDSDSTTVAASAGKSGKQTMTAFTFLNGTQPTYGRLHVLNATHAHWELVSQGEGGKEEGRVVDTFWVVQERHGKFQLSDLPDDVEQQIDDHLVAGGGQPGVLHVQDPETETKNMLAADDTRRIIIGSSFAGFVFLVGFAALICRLRRRARRRGSVRRWDTMDYKYGKTKLYAPASNSGGAGGGDDDDDDFPDDNDFEMDIPDGSLQTKKLINS